jgi:hypothetical protein
MPGVRKEIVWKAERLLLKFVQKPAPVKKKKGGCVGMIRYQCNYCDVCFDEPLIVSYKEHIGENMTRLYKEERCPICGCDSFREVGECQNCDGIAEEDDILCKKCKRSLKRRVTEFFDTLTEAEEQQFDIWMDGDSIINRRKWK